MTEAEKVAELEAEVRRLTEELRHLRSQLPNRLAPLHSGKTGFSKFRTIGRKDRTDVEDEHAT